MESPLRDGPDSPALIQADRLTRIVVTLDHDFVIETTAGHAKCQPSRPCEKFN
jgi:hypothetical protein